MNQATGDILVAQDIHCSFGRSRILNGANLNVKSGESVGIIGPNGSGKTTFFNCLSGFATITRGSLKLNESDITTKPAYRRALSGLGRVFQNSGVFREMTVLENMLTALESRQSIISNLMPWSKQAKLNKERSFELLKEVSLDGKAYNKAGSLSGGQLRLLEIARTLAFGAEVLLLDEPTAGVAPIMKEQLAEAIRALHSKGKTVLVIEHDIRFIDSLCSRIVVFDSGKVVLEGTPAELHNNPLLQEIYFGNRKKGS